MQVSGDKGTESEPAAHARPLPEAAERGRQERKRGGGRGLSGRSIMMVGSGLDEEVGACMEGKEKETCRVAEAGWMDVPSSQFLPSLFACLEVVCLGFGRGS